MLHARLFDLPTSEIAARVEELLAALRPGRRSCDTLPERCRSASASGCSLAVAVDARAGGADPRRADLGRRSGGARRLLGAADRPVAPRTGRHDLPLDPLHERGRALRPHLDDARRPGAGERRAGGAVAERGAATLEEAFIGYLEEAGRHERASRRRRRDRAGTPLPAGAPTPAAQRAASARGACWPSRGARRSSCATTRCAWPSRCSARCS